MPRTIPFDVNDSRRFSLNGSLCAQVRWGDARGSTACSQVRYITLRAGQDWVERWRESAVLCGTLLGVGDVDVAYRHEAALRVCPYISDPV